MAESSSDSEQSFDIDNIPEDNREHVREVLSKGKQITPYYNDFVLFQLYKRYYQADQVFFNQLRIISKRRKDAEQEGGWVTVGKEKKSKGQRNKFNFLEDKRLIWRATNWDKEQAKDRTGRDQKHKTRDNPENQNRKFRPKAEPAIQNTKKETENRQEKVENKKKQPKFKQKTEVDTKPKYVEQEKPVAQSKKTQYAQKKQTKNTQKYAEKPVESAASQTNKPAETKNVQNKSQTITEPKVQKTQPASKQQQKPIEKPVESVPKPTPTPKEEKKQQIVKQQKVSEPKQQKVQKISKPVEEKSEQPAPVASKPPVESPKVKVEEPIAIKKQEKVTPPVQTLPPAKVEKAPQEVPKVIQNPTEPKKLDPQQVKKNFDEACKKYPKVLKFIPPSEKMSKVSYEWINGSINSVKVHVPLAQPHY